MPDLAVEVTFGEPETGLWCDTCLLPSVIAVPYMAATRSGRILLAAVYRACTGCGGDC